MGFLSSLGFLFWGDVLLTAPGQSRPVGWGVLSAAQLLHFKCLRALAELSSVLLLSRSLNLKLSTSHPAHLIVTPVSMWAAGGEMTSLIESYYQSVQSDCHETVHQDSDEEDYGNNDSQDESLSQSTSSTSASVSSNSVRFLIIIQRQLIFWLSCNIAYSADRLTLIFLCLSIFSCQCKSEINILISPALSAWPPSPSTSTSLTPTPWWRPTWSACGAAPPPSSTWSGQSSAGATQTAGTCQVRLRYFFCLCLLAFIRNSLWTFKTGG